MAFFDPEALDRVLGTFCSELPSSLPRDRPARPTRRSGTPSTRAHSQSQGRSNSVARALDEDAGVVAGKPQQQRGGKPQPKPSTTSAPSGTAAFAPPTKPRSASAVGQRRGPAASSRGSVSPQPQHHIVSSAAAAASPTLVAAPAAARTASAPPPTQRSSSLLDTEDGLFAPPATAHRRASNAAAANAGVTARRGASPQPAQPPPTSRVQTASSTTAVVPTSRPTHANSSNGSSRAGANTAVPTVAPSPPAALEETIALSAPTEAAESVRSSVRDHPGSNAAAAYFARSQQHQPPTSRSRQVLRDTSAARPTAALAATSTAPPSDVVSELSSFLSNSPRRGRTAIGGAGAAEDDDEVDEMGGRHAKTDTKAKQQSTAVTTKHQLEDMVRRAGAEEIRRVSEMLRRQASRLTAATSSSDDEVDRPPPSQRQQQRPSASQPSAASGRGAPASRHNTSVGEEPHASPPQPATRHQSAARSDGDDSDAERPRPHATNSRPSGATTGRIASAAQNVTRPVVNASRAAQQQRRNHDDGNEDDTDEDAPQPQVEAGGVASRRRHQPQRQQQPSPAAAVNQDSVGSTRPPWQRNSAPALTSSNAVHHHAAEEPPPPVRSSSTPSSLQAARLTGSASSVREFLLNAAKQRVVMAAARSASTPAVAAQVPLSSAAPPQAARSNSSSSTAVFDDVAVGRVVGIRGAAISAPPRRSPESPINAVLHTSTEHAAVSANIDKRLAALERWLWKGTNPAAAPPPPSQPAVDELRPYGGRQVATVPVHAPVAATAAGTTSRAPAHPSSLPLAVTAPPPPSAAAVGSSTAAIASSRFPAGTTPTPLSFAQALPPQTSVGLAVTDPAALIVHAIDSLSSAVARRGDGAAHATVCFYPTCSSRGELQTLSRMPYDVVVVTDAAFADITSPNTATAAVANAQGRTAAAGYAVCRALGEQAMPRVVAQCPSSAAVLCEGTDTLKFIVVSTDPPAACLSSLRAALESRRRSAKLSGWVDFGDRLFSELVGSVMSIAAIAAAAAASPGRGGYGGGLASPPVMDGMTPAVAYYTDSCVGHPLEAWLAPAADAGVVPTGEGVLSPHLTIDPFVHHTITVRGRRSPDFPRGVTRLNLEPFAARTALVSSGRTGASIGPALVVACCDIARDVVPYLAPVRGGSGSADSVRCGAYVERRHARFMMSSLTDVATSQPIQSSAARIQIANDGDNSGASPDRSALVERVLHALQYALAERLDVVFVAAPESTGSAGADECTILEDRVGKWSYAHPRVVILVHARLASLCLLHHRSGASDEASGGSAPACVTLRDAVLLSRREALS